MTFARRWYRDPTLPLPRTEVTRFPHGVLEVKLSLPEGQKAPEWVQDLLDSGYLTEVSQIRETHTSGQRVTLFMLQLCESFTRGHSLLSQKDKFCNTEYTHDRISSLCIPRCAVELHDSDLWLHLSLLSLNVRTFGKGETCAAAACSPILSDYSYTF